MSHKVTSSRASSLEPEESTPRSSYKKPGTTNLKCRYPQLQLVISERNLDEILNQKFTILSVFPRDDATRATEIAIASFTFESGITSARSFSLEDSTDFPRIYGEIRTELSDSLHQHQARPLPIHFSPGFPTVDRTELKNLADAAGVVTDSSSKITSHPLAYLLGVKHLAIALKVSQHFPYIDVEAADRTIQTNMPKLHSALDYVRTSANALIQSARAALRKSTLICKGNPYMTTLYLSGFDRLDNDVSAHATRAISKHFGVQCVAATDNGDFMTCEVLSFDDLKKILKTQNSVDFEYYLNPEEPWTLRFLTIYANEPHNKEYFSVNSAYVSYTNSREPSPNLRMISSVNDLPLYSNQSIFNSLQSLEKVPDSFYSDHEPIRYNIDDAISNDHIFPIYPNPADLEPLIPLAPPSKIQDSETPDSEPLPRFAEQEKPSISDPVYSESESSLLKDTEPVATPSGSPTPHPFNPCDSIDSEIEDHIITEQSLLTDPDFNFVLRFIVGALFIFVLIDFVFLTPNLGFAFTAVISSALLGEAAARHVNLDRKKRTLIQTIMLFLIGILCVKTFIVHR